jgi:hypothetical protein
VSDGVHLPSAAIEFLAEAEPSASSLAAVFGLSAAALDTLVRALERRDLLDHLELLAESSAIGRDMRKTAAAAAYRLKSRGIKPRAQAQATTLQSRAEPVDLSLIALASPPGLVGRFWFMLGSLPGVEALEVKGDADGGIEAVEVIRPVARSRIEKLAREFERKRVRGLPVRASADLAVRLLDLWGSVLASQRVPPMWREVQAWRDAALSHGADPKRASSRHLLTIGQTPMPFVDLYRLDAGGIHLPTPGVVQRVLSGMSDMLDKPALDPAWVNRRAAELSRDSLAGWLSIPLVRERLACWLEATADIMYAQKDLAAAAGFLKLADELGPDADGRTLVYHPFFHQMEIELLGSDVRR